MASCGLIRSIPRERLSIARSAVMQSGAAFGWTVDYVLECAVGKPGGTSQKHPAPARRVGY